MIMKIEDLEWIIFWVTLVLLFIPYLNVIVTIFIFYTKYFYFPKNKEYENVFYEVDRVFLRKR